MSTKDNLINVGLLAAGGVAIAAASGRYGGRGSAARVSITQPPHHDEDPVLVEDMFKAVFEQILETAKKRHRGAYAIKGFGSMVKHGPSTNYGVVSGGKRIRVSFLIEGDQLGMNVGQAGSRSASDRRISIPTSTPVREAADSLYELLQSYGESR